MALVEGGEDCDFQLWTGEVLILVEDGTSGYGPVTRTLSCAGDMYFVYALLGDENPKPTLLTAYNPDLRTVVQTSD